MKESNRNDNRFNYKEYVSDNEDEKNKDYINNSNNGYD